MLLNIAEDVKDAYKIANGNHEYVDEVVKKLRNVSLKVGEAVLSVEKHHEQGTWSVQTERKKYEFDIVIFATWPKDVGKMLKRNELFTAKVLDVLSPIPHACVKTTVHSDTSLMPYDKRLWGTYNFQFAPFYKKTNANLWSGQLDKVNIFNDYQWRDTKEEMDREDNMQIQNVHHVSYHWRTPPSQELIRAREEIQQLQGTHNLYFAGAYQFHQTFHEDALTSAFVVVDKLYPTSARLKELRDEVERRYKGTIWSIYYVGFEFLFVPFYLAFCKIMVFLSNWFCAIKDFLGFGCNTR
jgi:predicted NAD/FAD-binding protein